MFEELDYLHARYTAMGKRPAIQCQSQHGEIQAWPLHRGVWMIADTYGKVWIVEDFDDIPCCDMLGKTGLNG